jgi:phosphoglucan,water dikinase
MTRIRDIAHRNDIPSDLKNDIKHRLQNKLHRCAEPSDLKTCEELINRVRNGDYNQDFKQQFEIFYEELKEFFNAQGLDKLLDSIKKSANDQGLNKCIDNFWHNKHV